MRNKPIVVMAIDSLGRFLMRAIAVFVVRWFCVCDCSGGSEAKTGDRTQILIQIAYLVTIQQIFRQNPSFAPFLDKKGRKVVFFSPNYSLCLKL
ncbi:MULTISPECIES: hypothetical protein [unclassified Microcoleus]|uniref:hypothetical protein n=1 Tax=unclassified Microcoleus TaxID=2642155 RepID=UPI0025F2BACD|nr:MULTISPECIES: hypothetical protein [unclassified Microcoleus]